MLVKMNMIYLKAYNGKCEIRTMCAYSMLQSMSHA